MATLKASLLEGYLVCLDRGDRVAANAIWDRVERLDLDLTMMTHIWATADDHAAGMAVIFAAWAKEDAADEAFDATVFLGSMNMPMEEVDWKVFFDMGITAL
jgi:hypothetical protein